EALVRLHAGELREAAPAVLVSPDPEGGAEHGIGARLHRRVVRLPHPAVDHHAVADLHAGDRAPHLPHDAGGVAPADVERRVVGPVLVALVRLDDVDGRAEAGPDVVVVDTGGHDPD